MKQKSTITFEMAETIVMRQADQIERRFCPNCERIVEMVSPNLAALISGESERGIFRLIESGQIHLSESYRILVCLSCVQTSEAKRKMRPQELEEIKMSEEGELQ